MAQVLRELVDPVVISPGEGQGKPRVEVKGRLAALTGWPEPMLRQRVRDEW